MAEPCTCSVGADECDGQFGTFLPLGHGGDCAVRPCERPRPVGQYVQYCNSSGNRGWVTAGPFTDEEARAFRARIASYGVQEVPR